MSELEAARALWTANGLPATSLSHLHLSTNPDDAVNSSFRIGSAAQTTIGLAGLSAAYLHSLRTGVQQDVTVDARHAVLEFHSEQYYKIDGEIPDGGVWDNIAGIYETKDNRFVRIHTNFPHHRRGILSILGIEDVPSVSRDTVSEAFLSWNAVDFETESAARGMCATAGRSFDEWDAHPQAVALLNTPPISIVKIGEAPKRAVSPGDHPLDGIRVLDLSRVLAGPTCGRTLAAHGADVLLVTSPSLPSLPFLDIDTSRGKRTTQLDLTNPQDHSTLTDLITDSTDVFLQAYRPGALEAKGFGVEHLAKLRPGIICADLRAWGWDGPWKDRRGFDSLVQTATGFNVAEGETYSTVNSLDSTPRSKPRPLPVQALDYAAGYLLAFGVNAALCKTITEGGSWEVRVSLAAVGNWIRSLGRIPYEMGRPLPSLNDPAGALEISALAITWNRAKGDDDGEGKPADIPSSITAIRHTAILSKTPVREGVSGAAPMVLNAHGAKWLPRV